jgi:hypothetical protein
LPRLRGVPRIVFFLEVIPYIKYEKKATIYQTLPSSSAIAKRTSSSSFSMRPMKRVEWTNLLTFKVRNEFLDSVFDSNAEDDSLKSVNGVNLEMDFFSFHFFLQEA